MPAKHKLLKLILPESTFESLREGTKEWLVECPCGARRDLWEAGGIKGGGAKQITSMECPSCGKITWHTKRKKAESELEEFNN